MLMFDTEMNYVKTALYNLLYPTEKLDANSSRSIWRDGYKIIKVCSSDKGEVYAEIMWGEHSSCRDSVPIRMKLTAVLSSAQPTYTCEVCVFDLERGEELLPFTVHSNSSKNLTEDLNAFNEFAYAILCTVHLVLSAYNTCSRKCTPTS